MRLRYRLIFLFLSLVVLILIGWTVTGGLGFLVTDFWFAAGLLLLVLISLIDQPFFSTDANVFMNAVSGLSLILVESGFRDFWWYLFLIWCVWLSISSYTLMWLNTNRPTRNHPLRTLVARMNREIGKPEALFSAFFVWGAIRQFGFASPNAEPLFVFWVIFIVFNIPGVARAVDTFLESLFSRPRIQESIADLSRVYDPRVIEINLRQDAPNHIVGRAMELHTANGETIADGVVIDERTIAGTRLARIATTSFTSNWNYLADNPEKTVVVLGEAISDEVKDAPISVVDVGSTIASLKFCIHPDLTLRKGEIVWTFVENTKVYYQVTLANIVESSAPDGNTIKSVQVSAGQLGIWNSAKCRFEPFQWVAPAGQIIYKFSASTEPEDFDLPDENVLVGAIPSSSFPVHVKVDELVTHNAAIIGVTGSGKSYLAFHLIETMIEHGIRVVVLDPTREHDLYLGKNNPTALAKLSDVSAWLKSDSMLAIHQFAGSSKYYGTTKDFISAVFEHMKTEVQLTRGKPVKARCCIIFEEAHSLVPEWNQIDQNDRNSVNETARVILQGRKYGLGSLLITQK